MMSVSNQSQKADIFLYITNISIIKLGNELCLDPGPVNMPIWGPLGFLVGNQALRGL